jgi:hypothetical protein
MIVPEFYKSPLLLVKSQFSYGFPLEKSSIHVPNDQPARDPPSKNGSVAEAGATRSYQNGMVTQSKQHMVYPGKTSLSIAFQRQIP